MTASTAGDHGALRVADVGWYLFEAGIEYDYIRYDAENDELHIAHPNGLIILGPGEGHLEVSAILPC